MKIVITGCSQGIGAELVKIWSKDHFVYGISRNEKKLNELKNTLDKKENFKFLAKSITQLNSASIDSFIDIDKIDEDSLEGIYDNVQEFIEKNQKLEAEKEATEETSPEEETSDEEAAEVVDEETSPEEE